MANLSPQQMADALKQAGWDQQYIPTAVAVGLAESGGNPTAFNNDGLGGSQGIWQIELSAHPDLVKKYDLNDPVQNAKAALEVFQAAGNSFSPWTTYTGGAYKKFLDQIQGIVGAGSSITSGILGFPQAIGDFFSSVVKSHDPCNPPADEPTLLKFVDFLSCSKNWWRASIVVGGGGLVLLGLIAYSKELK